MSFFRALKSRIGRPFAQHCRPTTKRRQHQTRLQVEALEAREVLNATAPIVTLADAPVSEGVNTVDLKIVVYHSRRLCSGVSCLNP